MSSRVCMNGLCGAFSSNEWKKGWPLPSGQFAHLCDKCGPAYEQLVFCDTFHTKDTGWRECASCGKQLHCGCIASSSLLELLDSGGVKCVGCARSVRLQPTSNDEKRKVISTSTTNTNGEMQLTSIDHQVDADNVGINGERIKKEEILPPQGEVGNTSSSNFNQASDGSSESANVDIYRENLGIKEMHGLQDHTNLTIALAESPNPFAVAVDERDLGKKNSSFHKISRSFHLLPKPPKSVLAIRLESNSGMDPQIRVARPPAEGRVKNQLLPRYWPRITDQELLLISGDSNSTIVPLFEKVLSASDAGRIGRLVLPKACAEAYFPPISQPEGLPLKIHDVKGKEWVFQFRFWPNNSSRMYVLEGVTPCIQSMQLQAGDTVTFSRRDPEGKLLMGFRKASNALAIQSLKGSTDPHLCALSKHGIDTKDDFLPTSLLEPERKRTRNIGSKSKRLLIDSQDVLELKLTWEEAQEMLHPPLSEKPSIVTVEDHEFEEYDDPPVFGKMSIFTARSFGGQEQWAQCESCSKWRRLSPDVLLHPKWTCSHNIWDQSRCSCSAPDELSPSELENLLRMNKDFKIRKMATNHTTFQERESSDANPPLTNVSFIGDDASDPTGCSVAPTTKHPRHRPGCSCIVCIQPPSGKGKHNPTCTCIVCMTVKRRFKTLMMRKKKRQQSECGESEKGRLDLNSNPEREGRFCQQGSSRLSMMSLLQVAIRPLENYLKKNGLTSLVSEQQGSSGSQGGNNGGSEGRVQEESRDDEIDQSQNDP